MKNGSRLRRMSNEALATFISGTSGMTPPDGWLAWMEEDDGKPDTEVVLGRVMEVHHNCYVEVLENALTGDMSVCWREEKERGCWIDNGYTWECDRCGYVEGNYMESPSFYCPECGAKMFYEEGAPDND